jgi:hypothetical protein
MKKIKTTNNPMNTFFPSVSIKPSTITKKEPDMNFSTILERDHIIKEITGILTSFEKKWRKHPFPFSAVEKQNPQNWTTVEKRTQGWLNIPPLGIAVERLSDAVKRYQNKLHFVHFENLTGNPKDTMDSIWKYLQETPFKHNFNNVEQYTKEHELGWPYGDHEIRNKVEPLKKDWQEILGKDFSEQIYQSFKWINSL